MRIISCDGNIGAGKSTLLCKIKEHYATNSDVVFINEPVNIWESVRLQSLYIIIYI